MLKFHKQAHLIYFPNNLLCTPIKKKKFYKKTKLALACIGGNVVTWHAWWSIMRHRCISDAPAIWEKCGGREANPGRSGNMGRTPCRGAPVPARFGRSRINRVHATWQAPIGHPNCTRTNNWSPPVRTGAVCQQQQHWIPLTHQCQWSSSTIANENSIVAPLNSPPWSND
jgi:hypothetical protein